jgi:hypothetical protein
MLYSVPRVGLCKRVQVFRLIENNIPQQEGSRVTLADAEADHTSILLLIPNRTLHNRVAERTQGESLYSIRKQEEIGKAVDPSDVELIETKRDNTYTK